MTDNAIAAPHTPGYSASRGQKTVQSSTLNISGKRKFKSGQVSSWLISVIDIQVICEDAIKKKEKRTVLFNLNTGLPNQVGQ